MLVFLAFIATWVQIKAIKVSRVNHTPLNFSQTISSLQDLEFDKNRHLAKNYLLYLDSPSCPELTEVVWNMRHNEEREPLKLSHQSLLAQHLFGEDYMHAVTTHTLSNSGDSGSPCAAVCLDIGTPLDLAVYPLPNKVHKISKYSHKEHHLNEDEDEEAYQTELEYAQFVSVDCQGAEVGFINWSNRTATIYWVNHHNELAPVGRLEGQGEGHAQWRNTVLGHTFLVVADDTDEILLNKTVTHNAFYPIGDAGSRIDLTRHDADVEEEVMHTFNSEYGRAAGVSRRFSSLGFDKGRLPNDLWGSISAFYYNNAMNKVREEWERGGKGLYVNWWEVNAYMITIPHTLKKTWQQHLLPLMEAWAGTELELTDIYGMRRYEDGARLLTHVDREATHAASLIINVAQGGMREDWPVEIYDHANRLHEVVMQEGDIVYYESAKCLHGRMKPLDGKFYVNLFAHYRPKLSNAAPGLAKGDSEWSKKPTPETVAPIASDLGSCKTVTTASDSKSDPTHLHGKVYAATACERGPPVPFLTLGAPSLSGPQTLLAHWKKTTHETPQGKVALAAIQQAQEGEHRVTMKKFLLSINVLNSNVSDPAGMAVLDFEDSYGEEGGEEEDEDQNMFDYLEQSHGDDHEGDEHSEEGEHGDEDAEDFFPEDHDEHDEHDEHGDDHYQEGDHDADSEHDGDNVEEPEPEEDADPYEPEPEMKETYNPYEMPEEHSYWVKPDDPDFLSDEELATRGFGGHDGEGEDGEEDPYSDAEDEEL